MSFPMNLMHFSGKSGKAKGAKGHKSSKGGYGYGGDKSTYDGHGAKSSEFPSLPTGARLGVVNPIFSFG